MDATLAARNSDALVVVFAKYPTPGRVKTRLIGEVTEQQAAAIHAACLRHTLRVVTRIADADIWLAASPDDADFSACVADAIFVKPQGPGDLGDRLTRLARQAFDNGYQRVAFVGCDCPELMLTDLETAFNGLNRCDLMIGPALDGGYYLIAMRRFAPSVFDRIDWGTDNVYAQTIGRAEESSLIVGNLQRRPDLDRPEDLRRLLADDDAVGETARLRDEIRRMTKEGDARGSDR